LLILFTVCSGDREKAWSLEKAWGPEKGRSGWFVITWFGIGIEISIGIAGIGDLAPLVDFVSSWRNNRERNKKGSK
jgi:hypothetical protein